MLEDPFLDAVQVWPTKMINGDFLEIEQTIKGLGLDWNEQEVKEFIAPELWSEVRNG
jgi:hypothetical protein